MHACHACPQKLCHGAATPDRSQIRANKPRSAMHCQHRTGVGLCTLLHPAFIQQGGASFPLFRGHVLSLMTACRFFAWVVKVTPR